MAQSARLELALRVLAVLAREPGILKTSAMLASELDESPVMIRRIFLPLHAAGILIQRKGPSGGARLNRPAKSIGLGDIHTAMEPNWLRFADALVSSAVKRTRADAIASLNETSLAAFAKRVSRASSPRKGRTAGQGTQPSGRG